MCALGLGWNFEVGLCWIALGFWGVGGRVGRGRGFELAGRVRGERRGERRKARTTADPSSLRLLWMTMQWWVGFAFMGLKASGACGGTWGFAGGEGERRVLIWLFWDGRICGGERGAGRLRLCGENDEKHASGAKQIAEKVWISGAMSESVPQGLKPQPDDAALMARLKPCRCYNAPPTRVFPQPVKPSII